MDNVTHTLAGLMLSRAGLNRLSPHSGLLLILAANAPDLDAISLMNGPLAYLHYHRGLTHSLIMMPLVALLPLALTALIARGRLTGSLLWAYFISLAGVASHLLIDWTNMYGVRLLLPFSAEWFRLDLNSLVDFWILAVLVLAVAGPLLSRLVSSEIGAKAGSGRGAAIAALVFFLLYDFGKFLTHQRAVAVLESRLYEGRVPTRVAAFPGPGNPLRWSGYVEGDSFVSLHVVNLTREFDPQAGRVFFKPDSSPALEAAKRTYVFQEFLDFSQFPYWRVTPAPQMQSATRVEALDMRFGSPPAPRFLATAIVQPDGKVEKSWFQFAPPPR